MDTQTCTVCGAEGGPLSFAPTSGWDWYRDIRLCPKHADTHAHLIPATIKADELAAERTRKAVLAVPCPYCRAKAGERCYGPTRLTKMTAFHSVREKEAKANL